MKKEKRHRGELMSPGWEDLARKAGVRGKFVEKRQNWHDYLDSGEEEPDSGDVEDEAESDATNDAGGGVEAAAPAPETESDDRVRARPEAKDAESSVTE